MRLFIILGPLKNIVNLFWGKLETVIGVKAPKENAIVTVSLYCIEVLLYIVRLQLTAENYTWYFDIFPFQVLGPLLVFSTHIFIKVKLPNINL